VSDGDDDALIGVPIDTATRVVGVNRRQLLSLASRNIVTPSRRSRHGRRFVWAYSIDDLVLARVVQLVRGAGVPTRQIERVLAEIRRDSRQLNPARLTWATSTGEVFVRYPDGSWVGGRAPNQTVLGQTLDVRTDVRRRTRRPVECAGRFERRRGTVSSRTVFAGSRVPVDTVLEYLEAGLSEERILRSFPTLYPEDIAAARKRQTTAG
jgi:uncharacterized protein (DUF433 family)